MFVIELPGGFEEKSFITATKDPVGPSSRKELTAHHFVYIYVYAYSFSTTTGITSALKCLLLLSIS